MNEEIEKKQTEIERYKGILDRYHGRWYWQGRRHLDDLNEELKQLQDDQLRNAGTSVAPI